MVSKTAIPDIVRHCGTDFQDSEMYGFHIGSPSSHPYRCTNIQVLGYAGHRQRRRTHCKAVKDTHSCLPRTDGQ